MEYYIGMDAHSKTSVFVVVNSKGQEIAMQRVNTSEKEIGGFLANLKGTKHLTFEESQFSRWLYVVLKDKVDNLLICNPAFIAKRRGSKNDFADAEHLAQQLRGGHLTPVFHDDNFYSDLRLVVNAYENLVIDIVRAKNRYKALFVARAIMVAKSDFYSNEKHMELLDLPSRVVGTRLFGQIQHLKKDKLEYHKIFYKNARERKEIGALESVPGISKVRANIIAAVVCDPKRFANKHLFWSYCMLVKHDQQSDGRSYGRITIFGKSSLKAVFMGAATTVIQYGGPLKIAYEEQKASKLDQKAAKKNLARKIASIALAVMRTGQPYKVREDKYTKSDSNLN